MGRGAFGGAYRGRVVSKGDRHDEPVHLVTSAHKPHSEEVSSRARKYLISMTIRTICLVLAIFVLHGWVRLLAIVAAIILPWFAVVIANAGPIQDDEEPEFVTAHNLEIEGRRVALGDGEAAHDGEMQEPPTDARAQESRGPESPAHGSPTHETIGSPRRTG